MSFMGKEESRKRKRDLPPDKVIRTDNTSGYLSLDILVSLVLKGASISSSENVLLIAYDFREILHARAFSRLDGFVS